jgi:hypothetical protein
MGLMGDGLLAALTCRRNYTARKYVRKGERGKGLDSNVFFFFNHEFVPTTMGLIHS